ncbi:hypothetical protein GTQ40_07130 [Flavobacteriaceae bacterium R38]|nr:hypothetical protein [Flavobacteriaceae bacterium R38]
MNSKSQRILIVFNLIITALLCVSYFNKKEHDLSKEVLKVRGVIVVDSLGVERAILGAHLPDPNMHGYRISRGEGAGISGLMLYDSEGQERGGYLTDNNYGNVFLTLDSKTQQNALFIADPNGGAAMQIWGRNGNKISLIAGNKDIYIDINKNNKEVKLKTDEE